MTRSLTATSFAPTMAIPDGAPPIKIDVANPDLSIDDILTDNFFNMESLQAWLTERGAHSRILTVSGVSMELLYDPVKEKASDGEWKPCLSFAETDTMLVVNKTRATQLRQMRRSPRLADWIGHQIAIRPGIGNGKAQIVVEDVPDSDAPGNGLKPRPATSVDDINDELFG